MIALPNDITFLKAKIQMLWEENEQLKTENERFQAEKGKIQKKAAKKATKVTLLKENQSRQNY
jgi:regulator of replication initiation timing